MAQLLDDDPLDKPRRRVWVQNVAVSAAVLRGRLHAIEARSPEPNPADESIAAEVEQLLHRAINAAYRENPIPTRWANWWRGTLIEAAYQNLHAAEAEIAMLYNGEEVTAETPEAVARVDAGLNRDDPRRTAAHELAEPRAKGRELTLSMRRALLRKTIEIGYAASDRQHSRLRSFRNVLLVAAALVAGFVTTFVVIVAWYPTWVPLCFEDGARAQLFCPTGSGTLAEGMGPSSADVLVVLLLGLTGGAVSAALSIRNMRGTSTPYGVPAALAVLKVPLGGLTALVALIAIRGGFVPGLSALDSQEQILAYAVLFGYAQQAFTTLIDRQAQSLLDQIPSKDAEVARPAHLEWAPAPAGA